MSPAPCNRQFTIQVTEQMLHFIDALARRQNTSRAEIARQALREYLDVQEDVIGSRSRLGNRVSRQLEEIQNRLLQQQVHADTMLLAAIILLQMRQGTQGSDVLTQIVRLAAHAGEEIRAILVAAKSETNSGSPSRP